MLLAFHKWNYTLGSWLLHSLNDVQRKEILSTFNQTWASRNVRLYFFLYKFFVKLFQLKLFNNKELLLADTNFWNWDTFSVLQSIVFNEHTIITCCLKLDQPIFTNHASDKNIIRIIYCVKFCEPNINVRSRVVSGYPHYPLQSSNSIQNSLW